MERNSTTLFLECPNAILSVPWTGLDNVLTNIQTSYQSPTREIAVASWQAFAASGDELEVISDPAPQPPQPDPKGFYEKLIGVRGDYPLYQVYQSISFQALNPEQDTSSLNFAITVFNGALNNNEWTQDWAKTAYAQAYNILKPFLSVGQITIVDAENVNFNLV